MDSIGSHTFEAKIGARPKLVWGSVALLRGAGTGKHKAIELRDRGMSRFNGFDVLQAVADVSETA